MTAALPRSVEEQLSEEDDLALWEQVLRTVAEDASVLQVVDHRSHLYAEVGVCSVDPVCRVSTGV
jgi:hypothetical protein